MLCGWAVRVTAVGFPTKILASFLYERLKRMETARAKEKAARKIYFYPLEYAVTPTCWLLALEAVTEGAHISFFASLPSPSSRPDLSHPVRLRFPWYAVRNLLPPLFCFVFIYFCLVAFHVVLRATCFGCCRLVFQPPFPRKRGTCRTSFQR